MRRWDKKTRWLLLAGIVLAVGSSVSGERDVAGQVAGEVNVAGIVIDYGNARVTFAVVPFTEDSLSGMDLLDRSGLSMLAVEFGGLGSAVCIIEDVGCDLSACRARLCQTGDPNSPFWQYVQQTDDGVWEAAPLGASSSTVVDGDVDGWFWSGQVPDGDSMSLEVITGRLNVDLDALRTSPSDTLPPILVTTGGANDERERIARWEFLGGAILLGAVATLGAVAVTRSRRLARR